MIDVTVARLPEDGGDFRKINGVLVKSMMLPGNVN